MADLWFPPSANRPGDGPTTTDGAPLTWFDANISSTMYLFTFLATVVVLVGIAMVLVIRAAISRRRFLTQLQAAIERGEALPEYQNPFYSPRFPPIPPHRLPPTPKLWEDEMWFSDERAVGGAEDKWEWLVPVSMNHVHAPTETPARQEMPALPSFTADLREAFGGLLPRRRSRNLSSYSSEGPIMTAPEVGDAPPGGSDVRVGVLVALPTARVEVPEENVCVGVMECIMEEDEEEEGKEDDESEETESEDEPQVGQHSPDNWRA